MCGCCGSMISMISGQETDPNGVREAQLKGKEESPACSEAQGVDVDQRA